MKITPRSGARVPGPRAPRASDRERPRPPAAQGRGAGRLLRLVTFLGPALPWVVGALALAGLALVFLPIFGEPLVSLVKKERVDWSVITLEEARDVLGLNTVEYVYTVVFPWDFYPRGMTEASIRQRVGHALGRPVRTSTDLDALAASVPDLLTPDEHQYRRVQALVRELELATEAPQWQFLVAILEVTAGIEFSGTAYDKPETLSPEARAAVVQVWEPDPKNPDPLRTQREISMVLPAPTVRDVRLRDRALESPGYPDIRLKPAAMQKLAIFMQDHYRKQAIREGILGDARNNAQEFLVPLLEAAGFGVVRLRFE